MNQLIQIYCKYDLIRNFILNLFCRSDTHQTTTQTDELINNNDNENFIWPLDPHLPLAVRKQQVISSMRR